MEKIEYLIRENLISAQLCSSASRPGSPVTSEEAFTGSSLPSETSGNVSGRSERKNSRINRQDGPSVANRSQRETRAQREQLDITLKLPAIWLLRSMCHSLTMAETHRECGVVCEGSRAGVWRNKKRSADQICSSECCETRRRLAATFTECCLCSFIRGWKRGSRFE